MKVSWLKLIWWVVVVSIVVLVVRAHWLQHPDVETPKPVETAAPVITVPVPSSAPPLVVIEKPVSPPVVRRALKSRVKHLSCSQVPSIAYNFSLDQVLSTAKGRGLTQSQLADLTACWEKHHGQG